MKRKWLHGNWYWVVAAVVVVIAAGILISVFRSYWLSSYILNFFGDWSVALSAGATVILAIAAFRSINEQRKDREKDRKERLLNEIIEWAIDVSKCDIALDPKAIVGVTDTEKARLFVLALVDTARTKIHDTWGKSLYISKAVLSTWQDLQKAIEELRRDLGVLIDLLDEGRASADSNSIDAFGKAQVKVAEHKLKLYKSAEKVIEEATKIKTRDIS